MKTEKKTEAAPTRATSSRTPSTSKHHHRPRKDRAGYPTTREEVESAIRHGYLTERQARAHLARADLW